MSRTKAREIALHLIFEMGFQQFEPENLEERLDENIMRSLKTDAEMYAGRLSVENADYIRAVVKGVATHVDELDGAIERNRLEAEPPVAHDQGCAAPCDL